MANHIESTKIDLWEGAFQQHIHFQQGLNLISGGNGTGKSQLLKWLSLPGHKNGKAAVISSDSQPMKLVVFNPKRTAQKLSFDHLQNKPRRSKEKESKDVQKFYDQQIQDEAPQEVLPIIECLQNNVDKLVDEGNLTKPQAATSIKETYGEIIACIFSYDLIFEWDAQNGKFDIGIKKNNTRIDLTALSAGENAVISLMFTIYSLKDAADIYLIDEPEVHLNWSLEEKLFNFLDDFCLKNTKQIITVTHSRVIVLDRFKSKAIFLFWQDGNIMVSNTPTPEIISDIAGGAVKIIAGITAGQKLIFVEDNAHKVILSELANKLKVDVEIQVIGSCDYVKRASKSFAGLHVHNAYFLIDGDNKPLSSSERAIHKNLVQLKKYCIENYLLNSEVLKMLGEKDWEEEIKKAIRSIDSTKNPSFKVAQIALNQGVPLNELIDYVDGSKVLSALLAGEEKGTLQKLIQEIPLTDDLLERYFPELSFLK